MTHHPRALRELHAAHTQALAPIWDPTEGLTLTIKVPARVSLHPVRTRCRACSHTLGDLVILRMYCSYKCARLPAPTTNTDQAPRECKRIARSHEPGDWAFKQRFADTDEATPFLKPGTVVYRCRHCFFLHIGNASTPPTSGAPGPTSTGNGRFADAVAALLHARGESADSPAALAAAKRDTRAIFNSLDLHITSPRR